MSVTYCREVRGRKDGGGAVLFLVLLLIAGAGAAWWFLFRSTEQPALPPPESAVSGGSGGRPAGASGKETVADAREGLTVETVEDGAVLASASGDALPLTPSGDVDWKARYSQLKTRYGKEFAEPKIGTDIKLMLASGTVVQGRISDISDDKITVKVATGYATYSRGQVSSRSQVMIFRDIYSEYSTQKTLAEERAAAAASTPQ